MFKKVGMTIAALLIGGMIFAQESVDLKASPKAAGSVDATWSWKGKPKGSKIGEDMTVITKPSEIPSGVGAVKGAKFEIIKVRQSSRQKTALQLSITTTAHLQTSRTSRKNERLSTLSPSTMPQQLNSALQVTVEQSQAAV